VSTRMGLGIIVAGLGLLGSSLAFAQTDACGAKKFTKKVEKPLGGVEKAFNAKQWDQVLSGVAEAEAAEGEKSEFDKYWIHEFRGRAYLNQQKYAEAGTDLQAGLASPCMEESEKPARQKLLLQLAFQLKDYPKVIEIGNTLWQANQDPDIGVYLGNAYYIKDDYESTRRVMKDVVAKQEAGPKPPDEITYRILQGACVKLKDTPCIVELLEKLVAHYPKPTYWQDLLGLLMAQTKNNNQLLNMWRLSDGADVMTDPAEYMEMAQLAIGQGLPGEAQAVLDKGTQKGVFTTAKQKEQANQLLTEAKQAVTLDKSTLEKQDAAARAKTTGDNDVKLGAAYLSYGELDKAIEALQRGIGKGGVKNPDDAAILLGIAYLRSNNKPEAAKAFANVKVDPTMVRISKLWLLKTT
jgi:tetratricopeptide (TPR) repeat protein